MFNLSNGGGLMASFEDRVQSLLNAYDTAENVAVAILVSQGDNDPDEDEVDYLADQIMSWEAGDISKYDVEDAIENYYELGADKVVAKKKKNDSTYPSSTIHHPSRKKQKLTQNFTKWAITSAKTNFTLEIGKIVLNMGILVFIG